MPKIRQFCWSDLKILTAPIITGSFDDMTWNLNCPYYHELKFFQKYHRFNKVIWIFELPPLSWGIIFSKIRQFWWCLLKIWPFPIKTKWNFCENRPVLVSLEKFFCPYYHHIAPIMKFPQKIKASLGIYLKIWPASKMTSWNLAKISKFWWCHLKNWTVLIISHNVAVFRGGSGTATSRTKLFLKIVNGF